MCRKEARQTTQTEEQLLAQSGWVFPLAQERVTSHAQKVPSRAVQRVHAGLYSRSDTS